MIYTLKALNEPAVYMSAAGITSSVWFKDLNESVLVPGATCVGIVYVICKIFYIIKNRGK